MKVPKLPKFHYYMDESDPDVVVLRRQDGAFVAAFSARGATREGIVEAAKEDYRQLPKRTTVSSQRGLPSAPLGSARTRGARALLR
jgi:hypothetical protein